MVETLDPNSTGPCSCCGETTKPYTAITAFNGKHYEVHPSHLSGTWARLCERCSMLFMLNVRDSLQGAYMPDDGDIELHSVTMEPSGGTETREDRNGKAIDALVVAVEAVGSALAEVGKRLDRIEKDLDGVAQRVGFQSDNSGDHAITLVDARNRICDLENAVIQLQERLDPNDPWGTRSASAQSIRNQIEVGGGMSPHDDPRR